MRDKTITNSVLGGLDIFTGGIWLGKHICQALGWVEWAQGLNSAMSIFQTSSVNWDSVFLAGSCVLSVSLIVVNFEFLVSLWIVIHNWRKQKWDATDKNIINYIVGHSHYGTTFNYENRFDMAAARFFEAVRSGKLKTLVRKPGQTVSIKVKPKDFEGLTFTKNFAPTMGYGTPSFYAVTKKDKNIVYESILCDWRRVRKIWPPKDS